MIDISSTGIRVQAQGNTVPELTGNTQLTTYLTTASGSCTFTGNSGSYRQIINLSSSTVSIIGKSYNTYQSNFTHFYVIYITPTNLPTGSPLMPLLNKKFQLCMPIPYQVANSTTTYRLDKFDVLTGRLVYGSPSYIEFQAYDATNLDSLNPIAQSSISFNWQVHTYYYKNYIY
jgi:hypothetical protein